MDDTIGECIRIRNDYYYNGKFGQPLERGQLMLGSEVVEGWISPFRRVSIYRGQ